MQETYNINIRRIGAGVGFITFMSLASVSHNPANNSLTSSISNAFAYESAVDIFNDDQGDVCISTNLSNQTVGDIISDKDEIVDLPARYEKQSIKLHITEVRRHITEFDFEEEYEEI